MHKIQDKEQLLNCVGSFIVNGPNGASVSEIIKETGLTRNQTTYIVKLLVTAGKIERHGNFRSARYVAATTNQPTETT